MSGTEAKREKKAIWGWAIYDWANSAFATTVMAGFFPIFFKQYWSYGSDVNWSTAKLSFGNSIASLVVAIMAPILGAIADRGSAKKKFMIFFAYLGVLMTASLFMVQKGQWGWAIFVYALGIVGFSGANVFYDSLLPHVASEKQIDYVSGLGFALGYLGGGILFLINVFMTLMPNRFGLAGPGEAVKFSFLSVALWWGLFMIFTIVWVPEVKTGSKSKEWGRIISEGWLQLVGTFKKTRHLKTVFLFLLAYWCYIDGVHTVVRMAVDYGMSLGFEPNDLIVALLIVQFVGFPSALGFSKLGQRYGVRLGIYLAIGVYFCLTLWGMLMTHAWEFYALAVMIGLAQGGIQALSRSYYSRLIPKNKSAEFFGFYNMLGKFAVIIGPLLMGLVGLAVRRALMPPLPSSAQMEEVGRLASRCGIGSILLLFVVGALLFHFVDEKKGHKEAEYLARLHNS